MLHGQLHDTTSVGLFVGGVHELNDSLSRPTGSRNYNGCFIGDRSAWRQDVSELHDLSTAIVRAERQRPNPAKRVGSGLRSAVTLP